MQTLQLAQQEKRGQYRVCGSFDLLRTAVLCGIFLVAFMGFSVKDMSLGRDAFAQCARCSCVSANHNATRNHITLQHQLTQDHISTQFELHRNQFIILNFFKQHVLSAMMRMNEQLTAQSMMQMFMVGAYIDADTQLDTQRLMQELTAKAHKDYQPSTEMCTFGTMHKNIKASQRQSEYSAFAINQALMDRQSLNGNMAAAAGRGYDHMRRWYTFIRRFCDPRDNGNNLDDLCDTSAHPSHFFDVNADVDYPRVVDQPLTINANLTDNTLDPDQAEIFALGSNLYGSDIFEFEPGSLFHVEGGIIATQGKEYVRVRSVLAKRSVAQNSFANIVGMKTSGTDNTFQQRTQYIANLLEQLGMEDNTEVSRVIGGRPSYHAQMELLNKKIYQRPEFYTNLYDKPANVDRMRAAMRSVGLMQKWDMFNSRLRSEMLLSVAAELELAKEQERVQNIMPTERAGVQDQ
ncbi:MAG: hypothetical protein VXY16_11065 [Pseudomonadota bacterium]|nr:hypothetical protein [Pseudomonadota bacterium]